MSAVAFGGGALKLLHPELVVALRPVCFLREIGIAAGLQHPNIPAPFDSGTFDELTRAQRPYYGMPYVAGESLRSPEPGEAARHRGSASENILLGGKPVLVADVAIAKVLEVAGGERLTDTSLSLGNATYMSSEQATHASVGRRIRAVLHSDLL